jgi:hypothetical protein
VSEAWQHGDALLRADTWREEGHKVTQMDGWTELAVLEHKEHELRLDMGLGPNVWALALPKILGSMASSGSGSPPYTVALIKIS